MALCIAKMVAVRDFAFILTELYIWDLFYHKNIIFMHMWFGYSANTETLFPGYL